MLYRAGKEAGDIFATKVAKRVPSRSEILDRVVENILASRWADKIEILSFEPGKKAITCLHGSFECVDRRSPEPVCDFQRGFWAGIFQALYPDMVCEGQEVLCEAKGDSQCKFQVKFFEKAQPIEEVRSSLK